MKLSVLKSNDVAKWSHAMQKNYKATSAAGYQIETRGLDTMIESINILRNEAQFSITSNHVSQHAGIGKLKAKAVRKLVEHDGGVLQALVDCARMANELADEMSDLDEGAVNAKIADWHQN